MYFFIKKLFSRYLLNLNFKMIDCLIFYLKKKFGLILSYILKDINFLVFRDFFENFLIFYEFIWIYFLIKNNKKF